MEDSICRNTPGQRKEMDSFTGCFWEKRYKEEKTMKRKKIWSLILTICLLLGLMPAVTAHAEEAPPLVNGYYELDSPEDLVWLSDLVNVPGRAGELVQYNAKLTANIDMSGVDWKPIGYMSLVPYSGVFDGQGYSIRNLRCVSWEDGGLFGVIASATIKNLKLLDVYVEGDMAGGIAFKSDDVGTANVIENCTVSGTILGESAAGGFVGKAFAGIKITNCNFVGTVDCPGWYGAGLESSTENAGAFAGWMECYQDNLGEITNSFYSENIYVTGGGNAYGTSRYKNYVILTNVGTKPLEEFDLTDKVDPVIPKEDPSEDISQHNYSSEGICADCGAYQRAYDTDGDGVKEIGNRGQLYWFAEQAASVDTSLNGILTADIVVNENVIGDNGELNEGSYIEWPMIGYDMYKGIFNGNGHTISGLYLKSSDPHVGMFANIGSEAKIINLNIRDSYISGKQYYTGGLVGNSAGTIDRCSFDGIVDGSEMTTGTDARLGGLVGYADDGSITNSYNLGTVKGGQGIVAGLCGQLDYYATMSNCYNAGEIERMNSASVVCGITVLPENVTNCYYDTNKFSGDAYYMDSDGNEGKTSETFASGIIAYALGDAFGQKIGTDPYPVHGGTKVNYGYEHCQSTEKTYSNDIRYDDPSEYHVTYNSNGYCIECEALEPAKLNADGILEIGNAGQLLWFTEKVNAGHTELDVVLTADITINRSVLAEDGSLNSGGFLKWTPIGNESVAYNGTFDGQGHTVNGLYRSGATLSYLGLFGNVGKSGVVKNVHVKDSYITGDSWIAGIAGKNEGEITNCTFDGYVSGDEYPTGGIAGANRGTITGCTNNGDITGSGGVGGIAGYNVGTIDNCVNNGKISSLEGGANYGAIDGIAGMNEGGTITNCTNNGEVIDNSSNLGSGSGSEGDSEDEGLKDDDSEDEDSKNEDSKDEDSKDEDSKKDESTAPDTGDDNTITKWAMILIISGFAIMSFIYAKAKKKF